MSYEKLTIEQEAKIVEYRDRYFEQATSCEPADRPRAEAAAREMGEITGITIDKIHWVNNPSEADALWRSLRDSRWRSLRDPRWRSPWDSMCSELWHALSSALWDSMSSSLRHALRDSLSSSLWDSMSSSLRHALRAPLWDSLRNSLRDSLWDSGWLSFYSYLVDILDPEITEESREKLRLHNEIAASCFAIWIVPEAAILCERPQSVRIVDGKLIDVRWRKK